ncbi:SDR family NAD(P)-dependent oxidoreductase [Rhodalgimonas zhirmunskyi]|uniref:SDR family NAD(P)-dependent oxidoreductase n=1 Tax=Rhodalgimonas zhirmunskyi TaxID=2964767 RepID=A0AAJ1X712_9RHOB|nr:SDR family NAD(P)-dependent oxidoreductase [Rhodoalgimonas zhirmunskyi]MDQ2095764.1 SDR family NAD(P)-dependent oxidoreductase [Rhodoalgimonas zhirmunskyi]
MTKSILITGCSSGIGYDAAHGLAKRGWRVFAGVRRAEDAARLASEGLEAVMIEMADEASITAALAEVLEKTGGTLDALYNNAAYAMPGAVEDIPTQALREIFEANLFGLHELTRQVIPVMRAQGHGRIVNCSSVLGLVPMPWRGPYVATKFALEGLTDVLRIEMRDTPIHISLIEPGPITSKIRANSIPPFEKWVDWENSPRRAQYEGSLLKRLYAEKEGKDFFEMAPDAVTRKLIHALESPRPKPRYYVTGATYLMGALRRLWPTRAMDWLIAKG